MCYKHFNVKIDPQSCVTFAVQAKQAHHAAVFQSVSRLEAKAKGADCIGLVRCGLAMTGAPIVTSMGLVCLPMYTVYHDHNNQPFM